MAAKGRTAQIFSTVLGSRPVKALVGRQTIDRPAVLEGRHPSIASVHRLGHSGNVTFDHLNAVGEEPAGLVDRPNRLSTPEWAVLECVDAQLLGPEGLTVLPDGLILLENSLGWRKRAAVSCARSLLDRTLPVRRDGRSAQSFDTAVSLVGPWTDNFYHWHLDYLIRLAVLSAYAEERPPLILPPETSGWMREALSLVGYDEDDLHVWNGRRTTVDRLIVPALPRDTEGSAPHLPNQYYSLSTHAVQWLGRRMCSNVADNIPSHAPDSGRLYVSRQGSETRRVTNLEALEPTLDEYGFDRFRPEEYSVAEQVRTFADADVVLGAHGAGLTNLLFSTDATLVELFGSYVNPVFYALSAQTDNEYACAQFDPRGGDLYVDAERFRGLLALANVEPLP